MAAPYIPQPNADLDFLLAQVAKALQLTRDQYALAAEHYGAVADWLGGTGSVLAPFRPWIYPQGSMALETTVRPRMREEYAQAGRRGFESHRPLLVIQRLTAPSRPLVSAALSLVSTSALTPLAAGTWPKWATTAARSASDDAGMPSGPIFSAAP